MSEEQNLVSNKPPLRSLFYIILNSFCGLFIGSAAVLLVSSVFYEGNLATDIYNLKEHPDAGVFMLWMQGLASLFWLIILPWIHIKFVEQKQLQPFFPPQENAGLKLMVVAAATFCFAVALSPIAEWNSTFEFPEFLKGFERWAREKENAAAEATKALTTFTHIGQLLLGVVVIGIIPGIGEEFVFRGLIQTELNRSTRNIHAAIWIAAILFSAIHFQFFGFLPRMFLGAFFGYLYYWSGNLIVPMFAHFFHNTTTLIALHFYNVDLIATNVEESESAPWPVVIFSALLTVALLITFRKLYRNNASTL